MKRIHLSGPMTGLPSLNFKAFHAMTLQPKGGMCCACQHAHRDCSPLPFKAMPPIQRETCTVIVRCTDFKRQL